jgi:hypothetical protein
MLLFPLFFLFCFLFPSFSSSLSDERKIQIKMKIETNEKQQKKLKELPESGSSAHSEFPQASNIVMYPLPSAHPRTGEIHFPLECYKEIQTITRRQEGLIEQFHHNEFKNRLKAPNSWLQGAISCSFNYQAWCALFRLNEFIQKNQIIQCGVNKEQLDWVQLGSTLQIHSIQAVFDSFGWSFKQAYSSSNHPGFLFQGRFPGSSSHSIFPRVFWHSKVIIPFPGMNIMNSFVYTCVSEHLKDKRPNKEEKIRIQLEKNHIGRSPKRPCWLTIHAYCALKNAINHGLSVLECGERLGIDRILTGELEALPFHELESQGWKNVHKGHWEGQEQPAIGMFFDFIGVRFATNDRMYHYQIQ